MLTPNEPITVARGVDEFDDANQFRCAVCNAIRLVPSAGSDDADCVGDPPRMVPCGNPICGPCMRRCSPEYSRWLQDGTDDENRRCCGGCETRVAPCACHITEAEDGERGCETHRCRAD